MRLHAAPERELGCVVGAGLVVAGDVCSRGVVPYPIDSYPVDLRQLALPVHSGGDDFLVMLDTCGYSLHQVISIGISSANT